jgi:ferredoxin
VSSIFAARAVNNFARQLKIKSSSNFGGAMNITVDRTKCEGYARCVQAAPKVFGLDAKMIAEVIDSKGDSDEKILLAARLCPTKAITVEEEGTAKKLFPE